MTNLDKVFEMFPFPLYQKENKYRTRDLNPYYPIGEIIDLSKKIK